MFHAHPFSSFSRIYFNESPLGAGPRVGTDHLYWKSGRSGRVGDLVGRLVGIFEVNLAKKTHQNDKIKPENVKFVVREC